MNQKEEEIVSTCFVCRRTLTTKGQHHCSKCRLVSYCSPICQKIHWKGGHKHTCRDGYLQIGVNEVNDEVFYHRYWGFCFDCLDDKKKKRCTIPRFFVMDVVMHSSVESTKLFIVCVRSAVSETIRLEMSSQIISLRLELPNWNQYRYYDYKLVTYLQ